jgi:RNAse (barnase) inhibitor barstar
MNKILDWKKLLDKNGPPVSFVACPEADIDNFVRTLPQRTSTVVRIVRGTRCLTAQALFQEWAAALQFPSYFGHNWDAFEDCLTDLDWLPAKNYLFFITNANSILRDSSHELNMFLDILNKAEASWKHPDEGHEHTPALFRVVFHSEAATEQETRSRLKQAGLTQ